MKNNVSQVTPTTTGTGEEEVVLGRRELYWGGGSYIISHYIQVEAKTLLTVECGKLGNYTQMVRGRGGGQSSIS